MYALLRRLLFLFPAETSHIISLKALDCLAMLKLARLVTAKPLKYSCRVMGLDFDNPVGLAAGLDKNAEHIDGLAAMGFGFIEVGTITPVAQAGNPKPRLFRLIEDDAIINRMGFNNQGVDYLLAQVAKANYRGVIGINIGKNKATANENAIDDYLACMRKVYTAASYITVNLSSPNTPGLRDLQFGEALDNLLARLKQEQLKLQQQHARYVPLAVKIAPDMAIEDIAQVAESLCKNGIDAVIATNTTIVRENLSAKHKDEAGGLSGAPLTQRSTEVIREFARVLNGRMPIIGVGGIMCAQDAVEKIRAGASLVQIYTGFIYRGPKLVHECVQALKHEIQLDELS